MIECLINILWLFAGLTLGYVIKHIKDLEEPLDSSEFPDEDDSHDDYLRYRFVGLMFDGDE